MKLKWGRKKVKPFTKEVIVAERTNWVWNLYDKYFFVLVMITCIVVTVWIWVKIYQLWKIHGWLMSF